MEDQKVLLLVSEFLRNRFQMVISTSGDFPWIATVYYAIDSDLNFYFLSSPETLHCKHIQLNPNVAIAVADAPQLPNVKKIGVQITATAKMLTEKNDVIHGINLWCQALNVSNSDYSYEGIIENKIEGRVWKVIPKIIKFFNQNLWEEGEEPTIHL